MMHVFGFVRAKHYKQLAKSVLKFYEIQFSVHKIRHLLKVLYGVFLDFMVNFLEFVKVEVARKMKAIEGMQPQINDMEAIFC